jgi:ribonuclease R
MTKKKKKGSKKLTAQQLQIEILRFLLAHPKKRFSPRQITDLLRVDNNKDSAEYALQQLVQTGAVIEFSTNTFGPALNRFIQTDEPEEEAPAIEKPAFREKKQADQSPSRVSRMPTPKQRKIIEGRVDMTRTGAAYIVSELQDTDIYVPPKHVNGALHGDIVRVLMFPPPPQRRGQPIRKPEGEILGVLKRAHEFFIGTLRLSRKYALLYPDNPNMTVNIYVAMEDCQDARDGEKVVVRVTDWQEGKGRVPIGKVTQRLGDMGGNDFEMNKILINAGFEMSHSEEAMNEAAAIPDTISDQEIARRRDFRDILTFTIDPEDAKDFDDALSIRKLDDGRIEVGVHIADVTYYLKPDSRIDQEAYKRSTSVYLVDRCNPMLPEKLSNNLCSLVPHQDRLTFSAVFTFDQTGKVAERWFGKTVIHSAKRFSYEEAQTVLDGKPAESVTALTIYPDLEWALKTLNGLALKMRKAREQNGAIGFETDEVRFKLDADGTPLEAYVKERKDAHLLIEDFMLLANKEVALYIDQKASAQQEIPFVYRVHDLPDMAKVAEFARFATELGYPMKVDTPKQIARAFNGLMVAARKDDRLKLLEPLAIRTMAKAIYTTDNIGHYGLGFTHYSHFTSPIRRYSDVLAHRILERNLDGKVYRVDKTKLEEQCKHVSSQERKAADAERESIKLKQVEYVKRHVGEVMEGVISGFLDRGFFVELPDSKAEGLVDFKFLDDIYTVEDGNLRAKGRRYGRILKMGDHVQVRIAAVDLQKRQIEMELAE